MKTILYGLVLINFFIIAGCIEKFTPDLHVTQYFLVVNGLITNQPEVYTVQLSWSITPGEITSVPLTGCDVTVHDDLGHIYQFTESSAPGIYNSDTTTFQGVIGRKYKLHINTNNATPTHHSYESEPVEMRVVPSIDSLFYEKVTIKEATQFRGPQEGCRIYLNTYDPDGECRFYRWDYNETWKMAIPYSYQEITNRICWISENSKNIEIKNTAVLSEDRITRHPLLFISNETDRLLERYSLIVNQYSVSENEFNYWEDLQSISQNVGGLYDVIPFSIDGNIYCIEDPGEQVLGYFSVSAKTSQRIYIDEPFRGLVNPYKECPVDTFSIGEVIPGLNEYRWIIIENRSEGYIVITYDRKCVDCTVRGTATRPEFWEDFK